MREILAAFPASWLRTCVHRVDTKAFRIAQIRRTRHRAVDALALIRTRSGPLTTGMPPMKNVTITLPEDVARWLRVKAAEDDRSVSRWIAELLERMRRQEDEYEVSHATGLVHRAPPDRHGPTGVNRHARSCMTGPVFVDTNVSSSTGTTLRKRQPSKRRPMPGTGFSGAERLGSPELSGLAGTLRDLESKAVGLRSGPAFCPRHRRELPAGEAGPNRCGCLCEGRGRLRNGFRLSWWDALIAAAAQASECPDSADRRPPTRAGPQRRACG